MVTSRVLGAAAAQPEIKTITGSQDVTVLSGDLDINILGVAGIRLIRRAWFWISANGVDLGANTDQPVKLLFFAKDTFKHFVDDADPDTDGLVAEAVEFHFVVQDVLAAISATDADFTIDSNVLYSSGLLVRLFDGTVEEFQRIKTKTGATQLDLEDTMQNAFIVDDDVALVLETGPFDYEDQDGTGEIHMRISPGDTGGSDIRLHFRIEYEVHEG